MKMKLLGLTFVLVFSIAADDLGDYITDCQNECNAGNLHEQLDLENCTTGCYFSSARALYSGWSEVGTNGNMSGVFCPGEIEGDLSTMCDTNPFGPCTNCGQ